MTPSWSRAARRKRLIGLTYMTTAAVALATAAVLFMLGHVGYSLLTLFAANVLILSAVYAFWDARIDDHTESWIG